MTEPTTIATEATMGVQALRAVLDRLAGGPSPSRAHRDRLLSRAAVLAAGLPPGALDEASALEIDRLWEKAGLPPRRRPGASLPAPEAGTTYWLAVREAGAGRRGVVFRVRLESLPMEERRPWSGFWPAYWAGKGSPRDRLSIAHGADSSANDAVWRAFEAAGRVAGGRPVNTPFGWYRAYPGDPEACHSLYAEHRVCGSSHTAAMALMFLSVWSGRRIAPSVAVTGDLDGEGGLVLPPEARADLERKWEALARERGCVRTLYVPPGFEGIGGSGRGPAVVPVASLRDLVRELNLWDETVHVRPVELLEWVRMAQDADALAQTRSAPARVLVGRLERLDECYEERRSAWGLDSAPEGLREVRLAMLARLCEWLQHDVRVRRAAEVHACIDELLGPPDGGAGIAAGLRARCRNVQASLLIDLHRFDDAREHARDALGAAKQSGSAAVEAQVLGTLGRIEAHARADDEGLEALERALERCRSALPWESNIPACYRIGALARLRRFDDARGALEEARRENGRAWVNEGWRRDNDLFLDYEALKLAIEACRAAAELGGGERLVVELAACRDRVLVAADQMSPDRRWPQTGMLVRLIEADLRLGDRSGMLRSWERMREFQASVPMIVGLGAGWILAHDLRAALPSPPECRSAFDAYVADLPDGQSSPFRGPRDSVRTLLAQPKSGEALAGGIDDLLRLEIY